MYLEQDFDKDDDNDDASNKVWLHIYIGSDPRSHTDPWVLKPILLTRKYLTHSLKPLDGM